jgi:myo-inositol catabolism protein IolC
MTASLGFDKSLYILAFDHRDFLQNLSGSEDMMTAEQTWAIESSKSQIALAKHIAYDGFEAAVANGVPKDKAGILVDEQFGADILRTAAARGYVTACPAEKCGQEEFDFEYGEDFAKHIETFHPTFCKAQVRYNPEGNQDLNRRQSARLKRLSDYLHRESSSLFMLELLLPPDKAQLKKLNGDRKAYDVEVRPRLMVEAIQQLQDAQVEPDVWRIEGLDRREDCEKVVAAARYSGRDKVGCMIHGGGKDQKKVREWLETAAGVPGLIGFAVGRAIFLDPLARWLAREITFKGAAVEIGRRYADFVNIFEKNVITGSAEHFDSPHERTG